MEKLIKILLGAVLVGHLVLTVFFFEDVSDIFPAEKKRTSTRYIVIHHTACENQYTVAEIDDYHRNTKGWGSGFAYQFFVNEKGKIFQVHDKEAATGHALNHNHDSIAICLSGNFDRQQPNNMQLASLWCLIRYLKTVYPDAEIKFHSDLNETSCCGKNLKKCIKKWLK